MTRVLLPSEQQPAGDAAATIVAGLVVAGIAAIGSGVRYSTSATTMAIATVLGSAPATLSAIAVLRRRPRTSTPADRVTLARSVLASGCAAVTVMVVAGTVPARNWWLLALTVPTLLLDAVDGIVARRTGSATAAGARLDMEVDAGVLVVLSLAVARVIGGWVLLIGAMRYLLGAASWVRPVLSTPLPRSQFRRVVAGLQGAALAAGIAPFVPIGVAKAAALLALGLLALSFGTQVIAIRRRALASNDRPGTGS